jgi:hypothetical protein
MADVPDETDDSEPGDAGDDADPKHKKFRREIHRERRKIGRRAERARVAGDVPALLRLFIEEVLLWTKEIKTETLMLYEETEYGLDARQWMRRAPEGMMVSPGFVMWPFMITQDAIDLIELTVGEAQATAFVKRLDYFDGLRHAFGEAAGKLAGRWDDMPSKDYEALHAIDRHRSELAHSAHDLCRYVETLANIAAKTPLNVATAKSPRGDRMPPRSANGWKFAPAPDGQTRATHQQLSDEYAKLDSSDLLNLCEKWRGLAKQFTEAACQSGHHGAWVIHEESIDRATRLLETACADRKLEGVGRLSRCLRRPDDDHLHWALATLDQLEAQLRVEHARVRDGAAQPSKPSDDLDGLLDDVNYCLTLLSDLRRECQSASEYGSRMVGGGETWNWASESDEAGFDTARRNASSTAQKLREPLVRVLTWGKAQGLDVSANVDFMTAKNVTDGAKAEICQGFELDVRSVQNAILKAIARTTQTAPPSDSILQRNPLAVLAAALTMKSIAYGLLGHHMMVRLNKPSDYDDRDRMRKDAALAEKHGYVLISAARALSLDSTPLARVLRDDRLWEYPNQKEDKAVFEAVAEMAEHLITEARVICAERGISTTNGASAAVDVSDHATAELVEIVLPMAVDGVEKTSKGRLTIVPDSLEVIFDGKSARFPAGRVRPFALLQRLARRPSVWVSFDAMCESGAVWDGYRPEDVTIRSTIRHLRKILKDCGLEQLSGCVKTQTLASGPAAILDLH